MIKLHLDEGQTHKSIKGLESEDLKDFSVLIWLNGSWKTQLLDAIQQWIIKDTDIEKEDVQYFNFSTFAIQDQEDLSLYSSDDQISSDMRKLELVMPGITAIDNQIKKIIGDDIEKPYDYTWDLADDKKNKYDRWMKSLVHLVEQNSIFQDWFLPRIKDSLKSLAYLSDLFADEPRFVALLQNLGRYKMLGDLTQRFVRYQKNLVLSKLPKISGWTWMNQRSFKQKFGLPPREVLNNILDEVGLPHRFIGPSFDLQELVSNQSHSYKATISLWWEIVPFGDLSSWEKILCAFAGSLYLDRTKTSFPKLLLLDEIDAVLHPIMIKNVLRVLQNTFLKKNGCKVILATHSASTVALVEKSTNTWIFEIKDVGWTKVIKKITNFDAVNLLSEWFMTLREWIKLFDAIFQKELTILSEGNNSEYIQKAIDLLSPRLSGKVQVYQYSKNWSTWASDIAWLFEFLKITKINKKALVIWDCDKKVLMQKKTESKYIRKFCFKKNNKTPASSNWIENLFDIYLVPNHMKESNTGKLLSSQKNQFCEHVLLVAVKKDFVNFEDLIEQINLLLSEDSVDGK